MHILTHPLTPSLAEFKELKEWRKEGKFSLSLSTPCMKTAGLPAINQ